MSNPFKQQNYKNLIPYFILAVAVIIAYMVISRISYIASAVGWIWVVVRPFFYGFVIAYIVNIPYGGLYNLFSKIKIKFVQKIMRPAALIIAIILVMLVIYMFFLIVFPHIITSVSFFITNLPLYYQGIQNIVDSINDFAFFGFHINTDGIYNSVQGALSDLSIDDVLSSLNAILAVPTALYTAIVAIISAVFMLVEKDKFSRFLQRFIRVFTPTSVGGLILKYSTQLNKRFKKYFFVQTLYGFICGVASTIALVALGSPYYAILGLLLGVCNYIPYIGSIVATAIAVLVVGFTQGLPEALIALVVIFVLQQVGANVLHPILMGQTFKFSPLLVIFSVTVGGALAGIFGMIIAIPIATVLKDMIVSATEYFESKRQLVKISGNESVVETEAIELEKTDKSEDLGDE